MEQNVGLRDAQIDKVRKQKKIRNRNKKNAFEQSSEKWGNGEKKEETSKNKEKIKRMKGRN